MDTRTRRHSNRPALLQEYTFLSFGNIWYPTSGKLMYYVFIKAAYAYAVCSPFYYSSGRPTSYIEIRKFFDMVLNYFLENNVLLRGE